MSAIPADQTSDHTAPEDTLDDVPGALADGHIREGRASLRCPCRPRIEQWIGLDDRGILRLIYRIEHRVNTR